MRCVVYSLAAGLCWAATPAAAQTPAPADMPGWWMVPVLRTFAVNEDTLPLAGERRSGSFFRLTPSVEARFKNPLRSFEAAYSFDSEAYPGTLDVLDDALARQSGTLEFNTNVSTRSFLTGRARYISTRRPEQVFDNTGLLAERRRTTSAMAEAGFDRQIAPRLRGAFAYTFNRDDFGPPTERRQSARSTTHTASSGFTLQQSPRTALTLEYEGRILVGEDLLFDDVRREVFGANTVSFSVARSLTPSVTATVLGGARLSQTVAELDPAAAAASLEWEARPELLVSIAHQSTGRAISAAYTRTAYLGYGAQGFVDTQSVEMRVNQSVGQRLRLALRPAVYLNTLADVEATSYRLDAAAVFQASRWLGVEFTYLLKNQSRALSPADDEAGELGRRRVRNSIMIGLVLQRPVRMK